MTAVAFLIAIEYILITSFNQTLVGMTQNGTGAPITTNRLDELIDYLTATYGIRASPQGRP